MGFVTSMYRTFSNKLFIRFEKNIVFLQVSLEVGGVEVEGALIAEEGYCELPRRDIVSYRIRHPVLDTGSMFSSVSTARCSAWELQKS